jgi:hypothetical protein
MSTTRVACPKCGKPALLETLKAFDGICAYCARRNHSPYGLSPELAARAVPAPSAEEARIQRERHVALLHPSLFPILNKELNLGNEVVETAVDWPRPGSIFIMLAHPFRPRIGELPDQVTFRELTDPHYWKAEYVQEGVKHVLACRF